MSVDTATKLRYWAENSLLAGNEIRDLIGSAADEIDALLLKVELLSGVNQDQGHALSVADAAHAETKRELKLWQDRAAEEVRKLLKTGTELAEAKRALEVLHRSISVDYGLSPDSAGRGASIRSGSGDPTATRPDRPPAISASATDDAKEPSPRR